MRRVPHPPTLRTLGLALLCLTVVLLVVPSASPLSLVRVGASQRGPTAGSSCANDTGTGSRIVSASVNPAPSPG